MDIELVIKIPEQKYNWIVNNPQTYTDELHEAIRSGVPLPKNHGDLIDRDELLIKHFNDCAQECYCCEHFAYGTGNERDDKCGIILDAPTIIEEVKADDE